MATKKQTKAKPKGRMGRPAKSESGSTVAQISVRLTESDQELLEILRAEEQARADDLGLLLRVSPADALRILLRNEGKRRGVIKEAALEGASAPAAKMPALNIPFGG